MLAVKFRANLARAPARAVLVQRLKKNPVGVTDPAATDAGNLRRRGAERGEEEERGRSQIGEDPSLA